MNAPACAELISELEAAMARGSSTGLAYRRCSLVWIDGAQVGVHFMQKDSKKKAEPSGDKG
jgi:hypothetical protein